MPGPGKPLEVSHLHRLLRHPYYVGLVRYRGAIYPGKHEPLIDRPTWERVQVLLGGQNYHCHALTYGGELMACAHCGHPITGECKTKMTKAGPRSYVYYRCAKYTKAGHPRVRVPEADLDKQVLAVFDKMRIEDEGVRDWFRMVLASQTRDAQAESLSQRAELQRQETLLVQQQDRLLNLRLADDIDQERGQREAGRRGGPREARAPPGERAEDPGRDENQCRVPVPARRDGPRERARQADERHLAQAHLTGPTGEHDERHADDREDANRGAQLDPILGQQEVCRKNKRRGPEKESRCSISYRFNRIH
jgi:hypothetical protein